MTKKKEVIKAEVVTDKPVEKNRWQSIIRLTLLFLIINTVFMIFFKPPVPVKETVDRDQEVHQSYLKPADLDQKTLQAVSNGRKKESLSLINDQVEYLFSSEGGKLVSVKMLAYKDKSGQPLELISTSNKTGNYFYRLNFSPEAEPELDSAIYKLDRISGTELNFSYLTNGFYLTTAGNIARSVLPEGLLIEKRISLLPDYKYALTVKVSNTGSKAALLNQAKQQDPKQLLEGSLELVIGPQLENSSKELTAEHGYLSNGNVKKVGPGMIKSLFSGGKDLEPVIERGYKDTLYLSSKYFANIISPKFQIAGTAFTQKQEDRSLLILAAPALLNSGDKLELQFEGYFGPKEYQRIKDLDPALIQLMGLSSFLGIPFSLWVFQLLKFIFSFVGNYGLAIIILTVLIKILFIPLTHKSLESMSKMQKLKPEMDKLKEKYKDNAQKLNEETMKMYQKHKVNPFSGCLPLLVQLPIFFALFSVLQYAIELRGQPFIVLPFQFLGQQMWITDLSLKDPTYILPVLMGISMFIQQKMSTVDSNDPQAKMMSWMSVIFTFMFLNFPSGLVIYWLVNNLLSIWQQYYVNKKL
ncbi:MAG: membrane protein insertase YidC [Candidatus Margulisiibacteriota bacterium]|jgi:YidC/Oxa1 family membrane protein insertase